jgi:hypothetical protein
MGVEASIPAIYYRDKLGEVHPVERKRPKTLAMQSEKPAVNEAMERRSPVGECTREAEQGLFTPGLSPLARAFGSLDKTLLPLREYVPAYISVCASYKQH